jgi:hypothetical protein
LLGNSWFLVALVLALSVAGVTTARQVFERSLKILDNVTFAFFVFVAVGLIGFGWGILATYMTLFVNLTLMAIALGSLLAFTIQYAPGQVAPELWHAPLFIRINRNVIAVWGLDFFLSAVVLLYRHATGDAGLASRYAWVLFSVLAALFTVYFPDWYRVRAPGGTVAVRRRDCSTLSVQSAARTLT